MPQAGGYVGTLRITGLSQPRALMTERSPLTHALSDRYEIEREVGAGGMATVYLARDIRHARQVALKVLHPELAAALGPERFLAEIRTTANLQHPHILPLHDSGDAEGFLFYVMPFVAGESLRQRLERETQLPIDDAVRITREVLSALDYAHRHGIIHRDIKPENILLHDGAALVADFGIALAVQQAGTNRMTQTGLSLGTPHYMSPEQAMGEKNVGGRADIYAAGAVLYEMLTGEPPFTGASVQAIIAKVMTERPMSPRTVRDTVPPYLEAAVMRALAKLPADRFATAKDFADALARRNDTSAGDELTARPPGTTATNRRLLPWLAASALGILVGVGATFLWRATHVEPMESVRFTVEPPAGMSIYDGYAERQVALSSDGRSLLFLAGSQGALYLRRLDQIRPTPVAGIDRARDFQLSPDGELVAYSAGTANILKKVRASGAEATSAVTLLADSAPSRFSWTRGQDIVYSNVAGIFRMPSGGGIPRRIAARDTVDFALLSPMLLEDGRTVAFRAQPRGQSWGVPGHLRVVSLDGGDVTKVDLEIENIIGYRNGFLLYGAGDGRIMGVRFDLASRKVRGESVTLAEGISARLFIGVSAVLGDNGTLAYVSGVSNSAVDIIDEHGVRLSTLPLEPRKLITVNWSPDGSRVLLQSGPAGQADLWVYDTAGHISTRLTQTGKVQSPVWTRDSKRVAFIASGTPNNTLMWMPADGSAPAEPIPAAEAAGVHGGFSFSFDGKYLIAFTTPQWNPRFTTPFVALPAAGGDRIPLLAGVTRPSAPRTSPDGRWMAYSSEEGERREVYLRPFPSGPGRLQLSTNGGEAPIWSRDGRHIVYRTATSFRRATLDVSGALPRVVRDDSLFAAGDWKDSSLHPDGDRFAIVRDAGEGAKLVVVTHWLDEALAKLRQH